MDDLQLSEGWTEVDVREAIRSFVIKRSGYAITLGLQADIQERKFARWERPCILKITVKRGGKLEELTEVLFTTWSSAGHIIHIPQVRFCTGITWNHAFFHVANKKTGIIGITIYSDLISIVKIERCPSPSLNRKESRMFSMCVVFFT